MAETCRSAFYSEHVQFVVHKPVLGFNCMEELQYYIQVSSKAIFKKTSANAIL